MQLSSAPPKIVEPFAVSAGGGYIRTIPVPSQIPFTPGAASYHDGFPPLTATAVTSGGIPPSIQDMNGILNEATAVDNWMSAGGGFPFDATFATAIGGYPKGARVLMASGLGYWLCILDNNSNNPDSGGAGWIPDRTVSASVYASARFTIGGAGVDSKIVWGTVEYDAFGLWDAANARFRALWAGIYRLSGSIYLPGPDGQNLATKIYKNGLFFRQGIQFPQTTDQDLTLSFNSQVQCAVGDYLEAFLNTSLSTVTTGHSASTQQPWVYGQIEYLGAN